MNSFGVEKGTTIRQPSTANLMVDSADRDETRNPSAWEFQITKNQSLFNGFFSRIGATEVVMEWNEPNVRYDLSNNWVKATMGGTDYVVTIPDGSYTIARALKYIASAFQDISGASGYGCATGTLQQGGFSGLLFLRTAPPANTPMFLRTGPLVNALDFQTFKTNVAGNLAPLDISGNFFPAINPDLRLYRYIDITSEDLTYAQDLKDNSTQPYNRDVLVRWYMDDDVPEQLDEFGFPIYMGYIPFRRRRLYNPPKQIKWDADLPVGNLRFACYDNEGQLLLPSSSFTNWLMTLQLSEN